MSRTAPMRSRGNIRAMLPTHAEREPAAAEQATHVMILDSDRGFLLVLQNRLQRTGWQYTVLRRALDPAALAAEGPMR